MYKNYNINNYLEHSELKKINSSIHLTFFSSSGYDYFKDFNLIKNVSYLPIDIKSKMNVLPRRLQIPIKTYPSGGNPKSSHTTEKKN